MKQRTLDSLTHKEKGEATNNNMSWAGVGNAAAGTAIADTIINIFTPEHNKPATKGDLLKLENHLKRYRRVENMKLDTLEQKPYFDLETSKIVYRLG